MRLKRLKFVAVLLLGFGLSALQAQEAIPTTGGDALGNGGSVSYSVGLLVFNTHLGTTGSVAEGVQQPYEISEITGINEARGINLAVSVYPNPATDHLTLSIDEFDISNTSYQLYDMNGRLLQQAEIVGNQTKIAMGHLAPAGYFIRVLKDNKEVKTFKVIKK